MFLGRCILIGHVNRKICYTIFPNMNSMGIRLVNYSASDYQAVNPESDIKRDMKRIGNRDALNFCNTIVILDIYRRFFSLLTFIFVKPWYQHFESFKLYSHILNNDS